MLSLYEKSCSQPLSLQYAQLRLCSDHQQTSSRAGWRFVDDLKPPVFYRNPAFILTLDKYTLDKFLPHGQSGLFYLDSPDAGMDRKNRRQYLGIHRAFHRPAGGFCFHPAQYRYSPAHVQIHFPPPACRNGRSGFFFCPEQRHAGQHNSGWRSAPPRFR